MKGRYALCTVILGWTLSGCVTVPVEAERPGLDLEELKILAGAAYQEKNWAKSEAHYAEIIRRTPNRSLPWFRLANIYARTGRLDKAVDSYREAVVRDPKMGKAWFNMGVIQLEQAVNSFHKLQVHGDPGDTIYGQSDAIYRQLLAVMKGEAEEDEEDLAEE